MALYVVTLTLPYESAASRFGVFHSNSETLFTPVFQEEDELLAHMFVCEYESRRRGMMADYSETAQSALVDNLRAFLVETFPAYQKYNAALPLVWQNTLNLEYLEEDEVDTPAYSYDASDLLEWYKDGDPRADVCQAAFRAWREVLQ